MSNTTNATAAPIVVPPSGKWDGNDGPWATFNIHVGTPAQTARVLVSTALGQSWVISANKTEGGCIGTDPSTCPQTRGGLVNINASSTWKDQGLYGLGLEQNIQDYLDEYDSGDFGFDTLGLGAAGDTSDDLDGQVIAALATKDYDVGFLGVTDYPTNFTAFDDPHASYLSSLKAHSKIPSLSFAYSAGAQYRPNKPDGTLTLGGYDASKFTPNDVPFTMAADISRDVVVGLQSITFSDATTTNDPLLSTGLLTFIDSSVPHIWLPIEACQAFEDSFGIEWNSTIERYLVNDTLHSQLKKQNASVSFIIGNDVNGGSTVNITFPYASFDLNISAPFVDTTQYYFPLRQAANSTQYTLGRTFLQEAYLIVNYEQNNFSVSQNSWVSNAPSQIIPIAAASNATTSKITKIIKPSHKISTGAIVGIIVAVVALIIVAAIAAFYIIKHRSKRRKVEKGEMEGDEMTPFHKAEMDATPASKAPFEEPPYDYKFGEEMNGSKPDLGMDMRKGSEMEGSNPDLVMVAKLKSEMEGDAGVMRAEAPGSGGVLRAEAPGSEGVLRAEAEGSRGGWEMEGSKGTPRAEMPVPTFAPVEMYAGDHGLYELPSPLSGSDRPSPISSPHSPERQPGAASWSRRQMDVPRLPRSGSDISSPDEDSQGNTRSPHRSMHTSRGLNPSQVSPQSQSRERQGSGGEFADSASRRTTPTNLSSSDESDPDRWRRGYGGNLSPRNPTSRELSSPTEGGSEGNKRLGSTSSAGTPRATPPNERAPNSGPPRPPGEYF
ncbi:hypothetical protein HO173_002203 [Letharia columbiana]|uniref:Peptidase A1 domain-containing protein n=1 Tax=Letharia columbiana TaxID=112416 RepID=A0A8H6G336_9LECA|nr:uncharacterized protein HO173_002203 [Letharia columbiana]KAF6239657.1 hypothetical protein HO173_002203 [Letharia columbiana]